MEDNKKETVDVIREKLVTKYPKGLEGAMRSLYSDNSLDHYLRFLGIDKSLLGRDVLDIGGGLHERFSRQASELGIKVVTVNPKLSSPSDRQYATKDLPKHADFQGRSVAALAKSLPFKDSSFDSVVSNHAIPMYLETNDLEESFREIVRVLKPGNRAYLSPVEKSETTNLRETLKSLGIDFIMEILPEELQTPPYELYRIVIKKPQ